jgi:hypothetical protein
MESVLEEKSKLLEILKVSLEKSLSKKIEVEGEYKRAHLEYSDRQFMHAMSVQRNDKLKSTKISLRQDIERDSELLTNLKIALEGSSSRLSHDLQGRVEVLEGTLKLNIAKRRNSFSNYLLKRKWRDTIVICLSLVSWKS